MHYLKENYVDILIEEFGRDMREDFHQKCLEYREYILKEYGDEKGFFNTERAWFNRVYRLPDVIQSNPTYTDEGGFGIKFAHILLTLACSILMKHDGIVYKYDQYTNYDLFIMLKNFYNDQESYAKLLMIIKEDNQVRQMYDKLNLIMNFPKL